MNDEIKVMVVRPGKAPEVVQVKPHWSAMYPLIDETTDTLEMRLLRPGLDLLCDEQGRRKQFPVNIYLRGRAPDPFAFDFVVEIPRHAGDSRSLMKPGDPGVGYFEILGTFLVARREGARYLDLTDADIEQLTKDLER